MVVTSDADFDSLPEGCLVTILSLTSPGDASRFAAVSPPCRLLADSDAVWEHFLPSDYTAIVSRAVDFDPDRLRSPKKDLYLSLHRSPVLIDGGTKSFSIDKWSGKKCFTLSARALQITWGDTPQHWQWASHPESRFPEVAELHDVWWLEIRGTINKTLLSPSTNYTASLVFKLTDTAVGFDHHQTEASVGQAGHHNTRTVCLDPARANRDVLGQIRIVNRRTRQSRPRASEGWSRIELGEFCVDEGEDGVVEMSVTEVKGGIWKRGLIVEGIEIRPK